MIFPYGHNLIDIGWFIYNVRQYLTIIGDLTLFDDIEQYLNVHYKHPLTILYKLWKNKTIFNNIGWYSTILVNIWQY